MPKFWNCGTQYTLDVASLRSLGAWILISAFVAPAILTAQISATAYRGLGQPDLTRNGVNRLQGIELAAPAGIAVDVRNGQTKIYIADTGNHRVLGWADARMYQIGDPPSLVLGQYSADASAPLGIGPSGFNAPAALAVDGLNGTLYVADTGNHRVLRFADPFNNPARVEPDAVYGQTDKTGRSANGSGNVFNSLRDPMSVAIDASGNLWIADAGNNRILRYPYGVLDSSSPAADVVLGQKDFNDVGRNRSGAGVSPTGFDTPSGLAFDTSGNLYVSDSANARVLRFTPPFTAESAASVTIGLPTGRTAIGKGLAVSDGHVYVAVPQENRVLVLPVSGTASAIPLNVFGQADLNGRDANVGVQPRAASYTLAGANDVKVDSQGTVFIADTGNNRILRFGANSRSADRVWGQLDFSSNSVNQVKPTGLNGPSKIAIDYSQEPFALYVSDTKNNRVLIWKDAVRFRTGDPADAVIGQSDLRTSISNADGVSRRPTRNSLSSPKGIAVDSSGNLYVADMGNHRVLRFPRPVNQSGVVGADLVLGQPDFNTGTTNIPGAGSLRSPSAVAIGPDGNIFITDTGNNRVVEYSASSQNYAAALRVYGQPNFTSSSGPRVVSAQTLTQPAGITVDRGFNLYIADSGSNRVVIYPNTRDAAAASNAAAVVIGSDRFDMVATGTGRTRLLNPSDVALDSLGRIYVADSKNSRVVVFPSLIFLSITDGAASTIIGQGDATGSAANWNSRDGFATAESMSEPAGIFVDRRDTLYIADTGNHRVVHLLKSARISHGVYRQASALGRGALVVIEGDGLADSEQNSSMPLSQTLAEREVAIEDALRAPLISVSPSTINLQLPSNSPTGSPRVAVRVTGSGELIAGGTVPVTSYAPGLSTKVSNQDNSMNGESTPAVRGTTIRLLGTGQGPVSPALPDGEAAPEGDVKTVAVPTTDGNACLTKQPSICVAIGNTFGEVKFSGLAAGLVGVWQLDVKIPENAPTGNIPVRAVINAVPSNIVTVAIR
jgi:uncharacterized protein (TIGR03437 family)